jgi:hypothetical protein
MVALGPPGGLDHLAASGLTGALYRHFHQNDRTAVRHRGQLGRTPHLTAATDPGGDAPSQQPLIGCQSGGRHLWRANRSLGPIAAPLPPVALIASTIDPSSPTATPKLGHLAEGIAKTWP